MVVAGWVGSGVEIEVVSVACGRLTGLVLFAALLIWRRVCGLIAFSVAVPEQVSI
jgi:hypothetical protein